MKKTYEVPTADVLKFEAQDVITVSGMLNGDKEQPAPIETDNSGNFGNSGNSGNPGNPDSVEAPR